MRGILAALLLAAAPARAAFEDLGAGARAPGMGGVFAAVADDAYAAHYNPAGLALLSRPQVAMSYSRLHMGLDDGSDLSVSNAVYAHPVERLRGTLAFSWHRFALTGLYSESVYGVSYGRAVDLGAGKLLVGASVNLLQHGFTPNDSARNAKDANLAVVGADPVLSGANNASAPDLDFGLLYRTEGPLTLGLSVKHILEPNLAFSAGEHDPVTRAYRLGLAYRKLWVNLASEVKLERAPDGGLYKELGLGAERYFPTLNMGHFGVRGGLAVGSHEFRQLSTGLTYRLGKLQFDYAFLIPLGGIPGAAGSHRIGMVFHFGAPSDEEQHAERLAKVIREGPRVEGYAYEFEGLAEKRLLSVPDVTLATATALIAAGRYGAAFEEVRAVVATRATKIEVLALASRLQEAASHYAAVDVASSPWHAMLGQSLSEFLGGQDRAAMLRGSQAYSLFPTPDLDAWLDRLEAITQVKRQRVPPGVSASLLDLKLRDSETLFLSGKLAEAEALLREVLLVEPGHPTASARLGSALYAQERFPESIAAWERALGLPQAAGEERNIRYMVEQAKRRLPQKPKAAKEERPKVDPALLERLYERGVTLYSKGERAEAAETFRRILELDPLNLPAKKALGRLEREMLLQQEGRP